MCRFRVPKHVGLVRAEYIAHADAPVNREAPVNYLGRRFVLPTADFLKVGV